MSINLSFMRQEPYSHVMAQILPRYFDFATYSQHSRDSTNVFVAIGTTKRGFI